MFGDLLKDVLLVAADERVIYKDGQYGQPSFLMAEVDTWIFNTLRKSEFEKEFIKLQVPDTRGLFQPIYAFDL